MLKNEVNYRLAKWLLLNMHYDKVITSEELPILRIKIAEYYNPPFLDVEDLHNNIGDGVKVYER